MRRLPHGRQSRRVVRLTRLVTDHVAESGVGLAQGQPFCRLAHFGGGELGEQGVR